MFRPDNRKALNDMSNNTSTAASPALRWAVIAAIAGVAFFASYRFAVARSGASQAANSTTGTVASTVATRGGCCGGAKSTAGSAAGSAVGAPAGSAGGCCGGGAAAGPAVTKSAEVAGGVQKISVDLSKGSYDPSTIELKAGVPAEITFGQGSGCLAQVQSQDLNFYEDLTSGAKTIKLDALQPGTYSFSCGMGMVWGSIVVK